MNKNSVSVKNAASWAVRPSRAYAHLKRVLDLMFAIPALILAAIPMLLICLLIRLEIHERAIFTQRRVGRNGKTFDCYKFRTMKMDAPRYCAKKDLADADSYITRTGKILRNTSIDELPQLINIVKGDMSFIGPRPLIPEETAVHEMRDKAGVYQLRPGISGYAQIHGRDMITDEEKVRLDTFYLNHFSLRTDLEILLGTFLKVLRGDDIYQGTPQNAPENKK